MTRVDRRIPNSTILTLTYVKAEDEYSQALIFCKQIVPLTTNVDFIRILPHNVHVIFIKEEGYCETFHKDGCFDLLYVRAGRLACSWARGY